MTGSPAQGEVATGRVGTQARRQNVGREASLPSPWRLLEWWQWAGASNLTGDPCRLFCVLLVADRWLHARKDVRLRSARSNTLFQFISNLKLGERFRVFSWPRSIPHTHVTRFRPH